MPRGWKLEHVDLKVFGRGFQNGYEFRASSLEKRVAKRARDVGLDPSNPRTRYRFWSRIRRIFENAEEIRRGVFRGQGPGGTDGPVLFFRRGHDVVVTTLDGEFVTLLIGGINNERFITAMPIR